MAGWGVGVQGKAPARSGMVSTAGQLLVAPEACFLRCGRAGVPGLQQQPRGAQVPRILLTVPQPTCGVPEVLKEPRVNSRILARKPRPRAHSSIPAPPPTSLLEQQKGPGEAFQGVAASFRNKRKTGPQKLCTAFERKMPHTSGSVPALPAFQQPKARPSSPAHLPLQAPASGPEVWPGPWLWLSPAE